MSDYWLDGTTAGTHIEDLADVPPFGFALPLTAGGNDLAALPVRRPERPQIAVAIDYDQSAGTAFPPLFDLSRSEEHTSELQSLMRISYAVFCLKKKNIPHT